jgi:predicted  nucleic acid-binding Zn-ribbon protein
MPSLEDAVLPILRNIQAGISLLEASVERLETKVAEFSERMDSFEHYLTYMMGMTERSRADVQRLGREMRTLKDRVDHLEPQPQ